MQAKRMWAHDYTRVGFYMITILTAGRRPLFGVCADNRVSLSHAGELVRRRWLEIPAHRPAIETNTLVVMPDHIHGIVYVKEPLLKPVGETVRGFKSGVTSELRKQLGQPTMEVWEPGYHDRVIMSPDTLHAERHYIHDNPRRYCVRRANPAVFIRVNRLEHGRLPGGTAWDGFGNLHLLDKPDLRPVRVSRRVTAGELAVLKNEALAQAWRGTVLVSPFISPGEKELAHAVMAGEYGSLILIRADGFPPLFKPAGTYFDLCAQGRLLVLSPFVYTGRKQELTRDRCLQMNGWVEAMCAGVCANNGAPL